MGRLTTHVLDTVRGGPAVLTIVGANRPGRRGALRGQAHGQEPHVHRVMPGGDAILRVWIVLPSLQRQTWACNVVLRVPADCTGSGALLRQPAAARRSTWATTSTTGTERELPRPNGITQKVQRWSQPFWTCT